MENFDFNYNVTINTINCINEIDFTYHILKADYPYLHSHSDYFEFTILLEGSLINIRNGIEEVINKNTLFVGRPKEYHLFKKYNNSNLKILNIIVRENMMDSLLAYSFNGDYDFFFKNNSFPLSDELIHIINKIMDTINFLKTTDWKTTNSLLKSLINILLNYLYASNINYINKEESNDPFILKLNDLKANKDFYTYCVNDLCYKFDYSRTHLNRLFQLYFNMSPFDYLVNSKMEYVKSLLLYTDYTISEISTLIGYNSIQRLTKNFKEYYKITPSEYKKNNKNN